MLQLMSLTLSLIYVSKNIFTKDSVAFCSFTKQVIIQTKLKPFKYIIVKTGLKVIHM